MFEYDVIVVGGGHAGCEAAIAASRLGAKTLLISLNIENLAMMPCNPAIGGPAKSNLVREIDALGGVMGIAADATYVQLKMLNSSKGPAVRALRAQSDKKEYMAYMRNVLEKEQNLSLKQCMATKLLSKDADGNPIDLGYVGQTTQVDAAKIDALIAEGFTPVISPIALGEDDSHPYNTNADVAASAVASALKARRLVFLCDVPGLMKDPKDPSTLISHLKLADVEPLKHAGVIGGGMTPKVDSGVKALKSGVRRVHFVDGYMPHSILLEIFTDSGIGTEIVNPDASSNNA